MFSRKFCHESITAIFGVSKLRASLRKLTCDEGEAGKTGGGGVVESVMGACNALVHLKHAFTITDAPFGVSAKSGVLFVTSDLKTGDNLWIWAGDSPRRGHFLDIAHVCLWVQVHPPDPCLPEAQHAEDDRTAIRIGLALHSTVVIFHIFALGLLFGCRNAF
jgi:hypothetical protein